MIQSMEVISVNIWLMLISLCNLLLLFLILKRFLYKPVKKTLLTRQEELDKKYLNAKKAERDARADKAEWELKLQDARNKADSILQNASDNAEQNRETIISDAKDKAEKIIRRAETEAQYERKKAADDIKREIADISVIIAKKLLKREFDKDDHKEIIDSFIYEIGENNGGSK